MNIQDSLERVPDLIRDATSAVDTVWVLQSNRWTWTDIVSLALTGALVLTAWLAIRHEKNRAEEHRNELQQTAEAQITAKAYELYSLLYPAIRLFPEILGKESSWAVALKPQLDTSLKLFVDLAALGPKASAETHDAVRKAYGTYLHTTQTLKLLFRRSQSGWDKYTLRKAYFDIKDDVLPALQEGMDDDMKQWVASTQPLKALSPPHAV